MKKILSVILALAVCLTLFSCKTDKTEGNMTYVSGEISNAGKIQTTQTQISQNTCVHGCLKDCDECERHCINERCNNSCTYDDCERKNYCTDNKSYDCNNSQKHQHNRHHKNYH